MKIKAPRSLIGIELTGQRLTAVEVQRRRGRV
jgi:hypothetical protein